MKKACERDSGCFEKFRNMLNRWQTPADCNQPLTEDEATSPKVNTYRQKKPPFLSLTNIVIEATNSISPAFLNDTTPQRHAIFTIGAPSPNYNEEEEEDDSSHLYLEGSDLLSPLPDFSTPRSRNSTRCYFSFEDIEVEVSYAFSAMPFSFANFRLVAPRRRRGRLYNPSSSQSSFLTYFSVFLRNERIISRASFIDKYGIQRAGAFSRTLRVFC